MLFIYSTETWSLFYNQTVHSADVLSSGNLEQSITVEYLRYHECKRQQIFFLINLNRFNKQSTGDLFL